MNHPYRLYVQGAFAKALGAGPIARNSEISVLNWARERVPREDASWESRNFRTIYKFKAMSLIKEFTRGVTTVVPNLTVEGDHVKFNYSLVPQLVRKVQLKQLDPKRIAWYPSEILSPDGLTALALSRNKAHDLRMEEIKAQDHDYEGILQCGKCKSKKTDYYQLQTRSADEPMVRSPLINFDYSFTNSIVSDDVCNVQELREPVEVLTHFIRISGLSI